MSQQFPDLVPGEVSSSLPTEALKATVVCWCENEPPQMTANLWRRAVAERARLGRPLVGDEVRALALQCTEAGEDRDD